MANQGRGIGLVEVEQHLRKVFGLASVATHGIQVVAFLQTHDRLVPPPDASALSSVVSALYASTHSLEYWRVQ